MTMDPIEFYKQQVNMTDWLKAIGAAGTEAMQAEDYEKRERLKVLNRVIGLPFDKPTQFSGQDIADNTPEFQEFMKEHGHELCAVRAIPYDASHQKLRMRGHTTTKALEWYLDQHLDPALYRVDFVPHPSTHIWSTIFVVNKLGVFGEVTKGSHEQLTQGLYTEHTPITFAKNWTDSAWQLSEQADGLSAYLDEVVSFLRVTDAVQQAELVRELQAEFAHEHVLGYFETVQSEEWGTWFIDYNRLLGKTYENFLATVVPKNSVSDSPPFQGGVRGGEESVSAFTPPNLPLERGGERGELTGQIGNAGKATGRVRIVPFDMVGQVMLENDEVLVCDMTTPQYVPLMQQAVAIVTDRGGILAHAAIVARELGKPCIVGTKHATSQLKDGQLVEVDAVQGIIRVLEQ